MRPILFELRIFALPLWGYLALLALLLSLSALLPGALERRLGLSTFAARLASLASLALLLLASGLFASWRGVPLRAVGISSFGVLLCLGLLSGFALALSRARALPREEVVTIFAGALAMGLVGARVFYFLPRAGSMELAQALRIADGGLSSFGGILTGGLYAVILARRRGLSPWRLADAAAPALALGISLARVGCFLYGCDFGAPFDSTLAVNYPARWADPEGGPPWESPAHAYQHSAAFAERWPGWVDALAAYDDETQGPPLSLPVHALPLYEASLALGIALLGVLLSKKKTAFAPGRVALLCLLLYAALRLGLEALRGDDEPLLWGLTLAQWSAAALLLGSGVSLFLPARPEALSQAEAPPPPAPGEGEEAPPVKKARVAEANEETRRAPALKISGEPVREAEAESPGHEAPEEGRAPAQATEASAPEDQKPANPSSPGRKKRRRRK